MKSTFRLMAKLCQTIGSIADITACLCIHLMIQLSHSAIQEILRLRSRQVIASPKFRLFTSATGCLSRSYSMELGQATQPGDQEIDIGEGLQVVINSTDLPYLGGLMIDYSEDMMGGGFRFQNPNAVKVCGCGNSFSITD
jgi:iron-sulfur cluster assembly protein